MDEKKRKTEESFFDTLSISSGQQAYIYRLALDSKDNRYLLSSSNDGSVYLYDVLARRCSVQERIIGFGNYVDPTWTPTFSIRRGSHKDAHKFRVSSLAWYPIDSGLFISGGFDGLVKLWDTNAVEAICSFDLNARVHAVAMSAAPRQPEECAAFDSTHALVAVACSGSDPRILDPVSGSMTHTLAGHGCEQHCVTWSVLKPYELFTGSIDGRVRLWDVRRPGALCVLDQSLTAAFFSSPSSPSS
eukprot:CAMPEP_0175055412 /NCGR_PEP_ID=MMETSP0052_2-20121109/10063_1 /TAXON_ID=51329 ORGANISM="Polytomella parva, Strain SAG 63-3" /NCGR_SAMPLE_ID=MMETSP0052_2 /ASSEMBLY_ACC=CAM_ASM_000194 /LENGTH=244 /DNA_ID=CAMNT_0016320249 /DNA_START=130 /DNA_END=861 /DNA_ORIENTATION=+